MLWFFGDSFVAPYNESKWIWTNKIGALLKSEIINLGVGASSLDHMYYQFDSVVDQISNRDRIVIALTSIDRRYFVFEHPELSSVWNMDNKKISNRGSRAISEFYRFNFHNNKSFIVGLKNFLYRLDYLASKLSLDVVILNCFDSEPSLLNELHLWPNLYFAQGSLHESISQKELSTDTIQKIIYNNSYFFGDPRANHMCAPNHHILSKKVNAYFTKKTEIDLTRGFRQNIINENTVYDKSFHQSQFFQPVTYVR